MLPPEWSIASGKRLSIDDFEAEFTRVWSSMARRFLKLECWQTYQEQEWNKSLDAYMAGNVDDATRLLREEAESSQSLYDEIKSRSIDFSRVRLITLPMTRYLEYELINYKIRAAMGENVEVVLLDRQVSLPNDDFFDCLVFDDTVALVHDYGTDGFQVGGWLVEEPGVVRRLEEIIVNVRRKSMPLEEFLRTANV